MTAPQILRVREYLAASARSLNDAGPEPVPAGVDPVAVEAITRDGRTSIELRQVRAGLVESMRGITANAEKFERGLSAGEVERYDAAEADFNTFTAAIAEREARERREAAGARSVNGTFGYGSNSSSRVPGQRDRTIRRLTRDQTLADVVREQGHQADPSLSFDRLIRGTLTGDWAGADAERRAMSEGTPSAGGYLVPTPLAAGVLDLARNASRVMQAGATTIPMDSSTLKVPRQVGDPAMVWHTEGAAIDPTGLTFDAVTLTARTLPVLVTMSLELLEDVDTIDNVISSAVAKALALELDRVALRGTGVAPQPLGVLSQSGVSLHSMGANGAPADWDELLDSYAAVQANNFTANAAIYAPRFAASLAKIKNVTTGEYLAPPAALDKVQRLVTNQVPINLTQGTATNATELYMAQWDQMLIGIRSAFSIRPLVERYVDTGEVGFFAYLRADVQLARAGAFAVSTGVIPAP